MNDQQNKNSERERAYDAIRDHSNCGVGVLMDLDGEKTHGLVEGGLQMLVNMDHRGARGAEENTGDGAGVLLQTPHELFTEEVPGLGDRDTYGVGQVFLPRNELAQQRLTELIETAAAEEGFDVIGWRSVPTDNTDLGATALASEPDVRQFFVEPREPRSPDELDTNLYILRRVIENRAQDRTEQGIDDFYVCSLDRRLVVYKGMLTNRQLGEYYGDLRDGRVKSSLAFVHSRFSTNTLGAWELAHPYRNIIHNGEINTLRGNLNWMKTRESDLESDVFGDDIDKIKPITHENQSDTAVVDNVLEFLVESGRDMTHALRMLVPEAWNRDEQMDEKRREWYEYHSTIMEPWDGPLLVAYTDGHRVGAILDRNGLRPCRYYVTEDNRLIMGSEAGCLDVDSSEVKRKGRLQPGQMFTADADKGRIIPDREVFASLTDEKYGNWIEEHRVKLSDLTKDLQDTDVDESPSKGVEAIKKLQRTFGYTVESLRRMIKPMSLEGKDPIGAMGNDTPLSVLSNRNKTLFTYFKQLFAQVSNPPIDYIREEIVTSLESHIGMKGNLIDETPEHCRQLHLSSPILTDQELDTVKNINTNGITAYELDITYDREKDLKTAIEDVRHEAVRAIVEGFEILVLSDRNTGPGRIPIPSLLATAGVHHHLIREGLRTHIGLVLETGQPCTVHHFACLIGYGAGAINPYLAFESIRDMIRKDLIEKDPRDAIETYVHAVEHGIQKVMSKMGISTLESYKGAQIFEAVGLDSGFVKEFFYGTTARTEGVGLEEVEEDLDERHEKAYEPQPHGNLELDHGGELYWRRDGEFRQWNPNTIGKLQFAARSGKYNVYREFAELINNQTRQLQTLRGLLEFDTREHESVPIEEVEPVEEIYRRFFTSSMSFGSLSQEVHEALAVAMNRLGGKACTGEGGEQVERFGTERECKNKQVASGRFGVTSYYLSNAEELEIKMAQGSKPGEGGHLPGGKVSETIAEVRHSIPGVGLISPPPHHDIYSIEDLAQLIHDLKCSNPSADISVKLVSEDGVGIIAAGVAKAKADSILISGQSGGTGASPKTSITSAGLPWELGLAESHRLLMQNNLRSRVRLRVDGGMKTGRDVVLAALLGAEEYGFGTAALITMGCVMLRKCHCNTCSVGIATQDPELRDRFPGKPEHVMNYMTFMAREVREHMAELGYRTMDEMIGQVHKLKQRDVTDHRRARRVDLSSVLQEVESDDDPYKTMEQNHRLDEKLDHKLIEHARPALVDGEDVKKEFRITNRNRTVGTMLSNRVSKLHGEEGLPDNSIYYRFRGSAGPSFGAFLASGITFSLEGDANDYVGKGLSGGKIIIRTPEDAPFEADENILIGNVTLYGGTGGEAYFNGMAGERFAVRNSGVKTVVEGVGDHGCEYMTGGVAVILGSTGKNFAAGMSGGEAYVLDEDGDFRQNVNTGMVDVKPFEDKRDLQLVKTMVENHFVYTGSDQARRVLKNWRDAVESFVKILPQAYARAVREHDAPDEQVLIEPPPGAEESSALVG